MRETHGPLHSCPSCGHQSQELYATCPACGRGYFEPAGPPATAYAAAPSGPAAAGGLRVCYKCDFEVRNAGAKLCPRCGKGRLMTRGGVRALGWVLLFIGAFLFVFMGAITVLVAVVIANSGAPGSTTRFSGGKKEAAVIFAVFGTVLAFGLASMAAGVSQIRHGRRNNRLAGLMMWIVFALFVVGGLVYVVL